MTYGISPSVIPVDSTGRMKLEVHHQWLQKRRAVEAGWKEVWSANSNSEASDEMAINFPFATALSDGVLDDTDNNNVVVKDDDNMFHKFHPVDVVLGDIFDIPVDNLEGCGLESTKLSASLPSRSSLEPQSLSASASSTTSIPTTFSKAIAGTLIPHEEKILLPPSFTPSPHSVVIGRGRACATATGTLRLKVLVQNRLNQYGSARSKEEKSAIISSIVDSVRDACPAGAFVKQDSENQWWEVEDSVARERVTSFFRNSLADQYKSSSKSKAKLRKTNRGR